MGGLLHLPVGSQEIQPALQRTSVRGLIPGCSLAFSFCCFAECEDRCLGAGHHGIDLSFQTRVQELSCRSSRAGQRRRSLSFYSDSPQL